MNNIYQENGFENRSAYLSNLADEFGLELDTVLTIAHTLGPDEDFDGLVISLEDISNGMYGGF